MSSVVVYYAMNSNQFSYGPRKLAGITVIATLLLPLILYHVYAQTESYERTVTLKITNTKTGVVHTRSWDLRGWVFEPNAPIELPGSEVKKMKKIFGADSFFFRMDHNVFEGKWLYFNVEIVGVPPLIGTSWSIQFV